MSHADSNTSVDDRPWYKKKRFMIPIGFFLFLMIVGSLGDSQTTPTGTSDQPQDAATSAAPAVPKTPKGKLQAAVNDTKRNVENVKVTEYTTTDDGVKYAEVQFDVGDNLSRGTIRNGIGLDVFDMAEQALKSGVPFDELAFRGMFPLTDKFGNTKSGQVFFTTFARETLEQINFDNDVATQFDNIENLSIDGIVMLHPDFRE